MKPKPKSKSKSVQRWEYFLRSTGNDQLLTSALDNLGKDGWELVSVTPVKPKGAVAYFKRPLK